MFPNGCSLPFSAKSDQEWAMAGSGMDLEVSSEGNQVPTLQRQAQDTPASHPWDPHTVEIPSSLSPGTWEYMHTLATGGGHGGPTLMNLLGTVTLLVVCFLGS